jgi:phosphoglycolate phosphatase
VRSPPPAVPAAVVFDLDGTLVDSAPDIAAILNATLAEAGLAAFETQTVKTMIGGGSRRLIERALAARGETGEARQIDRLTAEFERRYEAEPCRHTRTFPGARQLLAALASQQVRLGLCTNKPGTVTRLLLAALDLDRFFAAVVTGSDGVAKKPDPAMLRRVLADLDTEPAQAVMLGDSAADVGCARGAGCPVLLVSFGYSATPARKLGADAVIDSFEEALPVLAQLVWAAAPR